MLGSMKTNTTAGQVGKFLSAAREHGFKVEIASENVVRITKPFTPGDRDAFVGCDMFGESVLAIAPLKGGSVWGTDGGSIGGMSAITHGRYTLNKSGTAKRFMRLLAAHLATSRAMYATDGQ